MISVVHDIMKDQRSLATDSDNHIDTSVIIEISDGKSSSRKRLFEGRTTHRIDVIEPTAIVVKKQKGLPILQAAVDRFDQIVWVPIGQNQIRPSIQIEIGKPGAPARIKHRCH